MDDSRPRRVLTSSIVGAWKDELSGLQVRVLLRTTHVTTGDRQTLDCLLPVDQAKELANRLLEAATTARPADG